MRRGLLGLVAAASLALPTAAVTPAAHAAAATPTLLSISVSPAAAVINSTDTRHITVTATVSAPLEALYLVAKDLYVEDGGFDLRFDDVNGDGLTWTEDVQADAGSLSDTGTFQLQSLEGSWYEGGKEAYSTPRHSAEALQSAVGLPVFSIKRASAVSIYATRAVKRGRAGIVSGDVLKFEGFGMKAQTYSVLNATLQKQTPGKSAWVKVKTVASDYSGIRWTVRPTSTTRYRWVYAGDGASLPATSKVVTIKVTK